MCVLLKMESKVSYMLRKAVYHRTVHVSNPVFWVKQNRVNLDSSFVENEVKEAMLCVDKGFFSLN